MKIRQQLFELDNRQGELNSFVPIKGYNSEVDK